MPRERVDLDELIEDLFWAPRVTLTNSVLTRNADNFFEGDFRIGFNINRVFRL